MISMEEIVGSRVSAEGFAPIMVYTKKASLIDYGKCIRGIYVHNV